MDPVQQERSPGDYVWAWGGFGTVFHSGSNTGKVRWVNGDSSETCGNHLSADAPLMIFPAMSRGFSPDPSGRGTSQASNGRARGVHYGRRFRNTPSTPDHSKRGPNHWVMESQRADNLEATLGPIQIGSRQSPILRIRSAKRMPNCSRRERWILCGCRTPTVICSQIESQALVFELISDPNAVGCFDL